MPIIGFLLVFLCINFTILRGYANNPSQTPKDPPKEIIPQVYKPLQAIQFKFKPVSSELIVLDDRILLYRPQFIKTLQSKLLQKKGIPKVALVGIGGIGKTTLARLWGKWWAENNPLSCIWEINAGTSFTLNTSFMELAASLAQTSTQKDELKTIEKIQNQQEKEKKRLRFIQTIFKNHPGWLLIFDNVDSYSTIAPYIPQEEHLWGQGQVIITTRNNHLENISPKNILVVEELNDQDSFDLFARIRFQCDPDKLSKEEKDDVLKSLKYIPSFPLDVSIAAQYMRSHSLSCDTYINSIQHQTKEFNKNQEMTKASDYTKHVIN